MKDFVSIPPMTGTHRVTANGSTSVHRQGHVTTLAQRGRCCAAMLAALSLALSNGCVASGRYHAALEEGRVARGELEQERQARGQERATHEAKEAELTRQLTLATSEVQEREARVSALTVESHNVQAKLDEATAIDQKLRAELERLGKNVDQLLADRGTMSLALEEAKTRLVELRKAQAATEARTALTRQLVAKFKQVIQSSPAGTLELVIRDGRLVLQLPSDGAFESTRTTLRGDAQRALASLATALQSIGHRKFQVAGHTDNVPPSGGGNTSNWEVSTARAAAVVRFLITRGVSPGVLSAAGYAEFSPLYPNDTPQHRAQNRRIEITLVPGPEDLLGMPGI